MAYNWKVLYRWRTMQDELDELERTDPAVAKAAADYDRVVKEIVDKPMTPPDLKRCQAQVPGNGPFTMGGKIGDPRDGYRVRCESEPTVVVTEVAAASDGRKGSMALCDDCLAAFKGQDGTPAVLVTKIHDATYDEGDE